MIISGISIILVGVVLIASNRSNVISHLLDWLWLISMKRYSDIYRPNRKHSFQPQQIKTSGFLLVVLGLSVSLLGYLKNI